MDAPNHPPNLTLDAANAIRPRTRPPNIHQLKETPRKQKPHSNQYDSNADEMHAGKVQQIWAQTVLENLRYENGAIEHFLHKYVPSDPSCGPYVLPPDVSFHGVPHEKGSESQMYEPLVRLQFLEGYQGG